MSSGKLQEFLDKHKYCPLCKQKVSFDGLSSPINDILYLSGKKYIQINIKTDTIIGLNRLESFDVSDYESEDAMLERILKKKPGIKTAKLNNLRFVCKTCPSSSDRRWSFNPEMISYFEIIYEKATGKIVDIKKESDKYFLEIDKKLFEIAFSHEDRYVSLSNRAQNKTQSLLYNSFNFDKISKEYLLNKIKMHLILA